MSQDGNVYRISLVNAPSGYTVLNDFKHEMSMPHEAFVQAAINNGLYHRFAISTKEWTIHHISDWFPLDLSPWTAILLPLGIDMDVEFYLSDPEDWPFIHMFVTK